MAPCNTEFHPAAMVNSRMTTTVTPTKPKEKTLPAPHEMGGKEDAQMTIVWSNVVKFGILHIVGLNGLALLPGAHTKTMVFAFLMWLVAVVSITAGSHRLWSHRSYKASFPLRFFLMITNCIAMENSIFVWARDHRVHHKYSETTADPHDANRGFFFAHIGWLLVRKHPEVIRKGSKIDLSDLKADKLIMFQHQYYLPLALLFCFVIPTAIPMYFWGEAFWASYTVTVFRYLLILHCTWLVNSAAHFFGGRPYDVNINPSQNRLVSLLAVGEGHHNYHHTFPYDYSASEWQWALNFTTMFIDIMAFVGMAYGRKSVSKEMLEARMKRTGLGTEKKMTGEREEMLY
jgi:stearoyl-CoA desaturase (delta-9 desaturase)